MPKKKIESIVKAVNKAMLGLVVPSAAYPRPPKKAGPRAKSKMEKKLESYLPGKHRADAKFYLDKAARLDRNLTQMQRTRVRKAKKK